MKNLFVHSFYSFVLRPLFKMFYGLRFKNAKSLKKESQFIIVGNHNSHFDSLSLMSQMDLKTFSKIRNVASYDYFGSTKIKENLTVLLVNGVLIKKGGEENKGEKALDAMNRLLKEGKSLILFPEGTRGEPGKIEDFKYGIAKLLKSNPQIPFIPVYFDGLGRVWPKGTSIPLPLNSKIILGDPRKVKSSELDSILDEVRTAIFDLKPDTEWDTNRFYESENRENQLIIQKQ